MELEEARSRFIETWGQLGTQWGINRTMAQIHALLLSTSKALSTDDVMAQLNISRGNANMNLRDLVAWGIVRKKFVKGDRKEYFYAVQDIWEVARLIARERKKRELEPLIRLLGDIGNVQGNAPDTEQFNRITSELKGIAQRSDELIELFTRSEPETWMQWLASPSIQKQ